MVQEKRNEREEFAGDRSVDELESLLAAAQQRIASLEETQEFILSKLEEFEGAQSIGGTHGSFKVRAWLSPLCFSPPPHLDCVGVTRQRVVLTSSE